MYLYRTCYPVLFLIVKPQSPSISSYLGILNRQKSSNLSRFLCKILSENGAEMAQISAILFSRHCRRAIIFCFSAIAMCATFFSSRQWRAGAKSGASAQHCIYR